MENYEKYSKENAPIKKNKKVQTACEVGDNVYNVNSFYNVVNNAIENVNYIKNTKDDKDNNEIAIKKRGYKNK